MGIRIGLTGGIGTGKTTVAQYLAQAYQLPLFDADVYAREAVKLGSLVLQEIARRYGQQVLVADGNLDRKALGEIIFNNIEEKRWIEGQIHPYVRDRFGSELEGVQTDLVVLAIPLLFEAQMTDLVDRIWVVSCSPQQQLERLLKRDSLSVEQARSRINSQWPLAEKIAQADVVLDNSSTLKALFEQVDRAIEGIR